MTGASSDVWEVMSTARTIRRFTDEAVEGVMLTRCLEAARWAPSGANAQGWRFVVLRSPDQRAAVAKAAAQALQVVEPASTSITGTGQPMASSHRLRPAPAPGRWLRIDTSYAETEINNSAIENDILAVPVTTGGAPNAVGVRC